MQALSAGARLGNGEPLAQRDVPSLAAGPFAEFVTSTVTSGGRVVALFGAASKPPRVAVYAVLAGAGEQGLHVASCEVEGGFASLTPRVPQVHLFERELAEQFGLRPEGHPWMRPVRFGPPLAARAQGAAPGVPGVAPFFAMEGEEVHEVAVGPVHAGVIEPGHFRFQAHGETVHHLEIALGYQHRGIERAMAGGPTPRTQLLAETAAGDSTIAHATAYAQSIEGLSGTAPSTRAAALRAVALELERIANHVGDLGALAGDVAFLPSAAWCGRLRGDFLNLTTALTGSRLGRAFLSPGGVRADADAGLASALREGLSAALQDSQGAVDVLWGAASVRDRFEGTGVLARDACVELGIVGVAARAAGVPRDVRREFPTGMYADRPIEARLWPTGDVLARARVRWMEVEQSGRYVEDLLAGLPEGQIQAATGALAPNSLCASLVEGWRGEVAHIALTDADGRFSRYKIVDPSFHNWQGLAMAMRGAQISDFPLINKSFNLSYAGHDL